MRSSPAGAAWSIDDPVETPRLLLRPHRATDVDDLLVFHSDPEVTRFLPWPVRDRAAVAETLQTKLTQHRAAADGDWLVLAIEVRESGRVIGEVLLKRDPRVAELGFALSRAHWGMGYGSEAARAMLDLGRRFGVAAFTAVADPRNTASARLLVGLGFVPAGRSERNGLELQVFRLDDPAPTIVGTEDGR
ncbi:GNAT family N-acetyltransferase [Microcella daejeonensis]|uniref:GNAT family N-acetyltransferase n=1 Tax=Microcella daejeonensis TaxID=2994971 RepID=A0A9E8S8N0_9MICO|nr:GNAT family N-acetyltransferase [Microcella daejeonensis]WAB81428.1 GNAT family N-acetyltransferase [Microcella daejeonensis]